MKPSIGIIGAGKVGGTLARLLREAGYTIQTVYSRTQQHAAALAAQVGARAVNAPTDGSADLTLLTVPDDTISAVAEVLAKSDLKSRAFVHTSGTQDVAALAAITARNGSVGSLHPAFPFADVETSIKRLPGAAFAVEADDEHLRDWLLDMVAALDGQALLIPPGSKALYHAALVIASNYTVTLYALAEQLLIGLGAEHAAAVAVLNPLVNATASNLAAQGIPGALTGPLIRADAGTIEAHLSALNAVDPAIAELYRQLGVLTLPLVAARGVNTEKMERLLNQQSTFDVMKGASK